MKENKDYKKMLNELKKGHFDKARKIYKMKFSQFNSSSSDAINQSIQENRAAQEAANKSRENVLIETSEVLTSYGEAVSKQISKEFKSIADGIKNNIKNFQGKRIRTADQAVASLNKVLANPSMKINNTDKTAIINAWKHINMQDISNKFANLSRFFKVGDLALKAEKIRENMIIGWDTGNWQPLVLETEAMALSQTGTTIAMSLMMGTLSLLSLSGIPLAILTIIGISFITYLASFVDAKLVDRINNELIRPAY